MRTLHEAAQWVGMPSSPLPTVVVVGAASAAVLDVVSARTLAEAKQYVGDPAVTLVVADTAPDGGAGPLLDAVRKHASSGGTTIVLRATTIPEALTWDVPGAVELVLPATLGDLAALTGLSGAHLTQDLTADISTLRAVKDAEAVLGWKRGVLWLDPTSGRVLISGAHARMPVAPDAVAVCDDVEAHAGHAHGVPDADVGCYNGFSAFVERDRVLERWPKSLVMEVRLSGNVVLGGSPRGANMHWVGGRQRLSCVELLSLCRECGVATTMLSGKDRGGEPTALVERCEDHLVAHTVTQEQLAELLPGVELRTSAETAGR